MAEPELKLGSFYSKSFALHFCSSSVEENISGYKQIQFNSANAFSMLTVSWAPVLYLGAVKAQDRLQFQGLLVFQGQGMGGFVNVNEMLWNQKTVMIFGTTFLQNHNFILKREDPNKSAYSYQLCFVCVWVQGSSINCLGGIKDI